MTPQDRDLERLDELLRNQARSPGPAVASAVLARLGERRAARRPSIVRPLLLAGSVALLCLGLGAALGYRAGAGDAPPAPLRTVHFALEAPGAKTVVLVGDFNGWAPEQGLTLTARDGERFVATMELPAGRYAYAFVVDGARVVSDPAAPAYEPDGFGGRNSVLEL